jgi:pimeloyl-ACP methyl ester carboxylesterase
MEQYADDVVGMADHLGLDKFTYVGHSMGGVIGMELGIRYGDRLNKLVLVAPAPADGVQGPPELHERSARLRQGTGSRDDDPGAHGDDGPGRDPKHIEGAVDRALSVSDGHFEESWRGLVEYTRATCSRRSRRRRS